MDWVPLAEYDNGMNLNDRPRRLTVDEIKYITDHLPLAPSADSTAAEVNRQGIIDWMTDSLKEISIAPSSIPELIQYILRQHHKSLITPGTPVGITAAEAVGATTTQMTLNSIAPWEKILLQDNEGVTSLVSIGNWVDDLLSKASNIKYIPTNRTQYLELDNPINIATPDEYGNVIWAPVIAVTKHIPIGNLVKITTLSGREVTVTQSKSLLVWETNRFVQRNGNSVVIGDIVPVTANMPDPKPMKSTSITLDKHFGRIVGLFMPNGHVTGDDISIETNVTGTQHIKAWCDSVHIHCDIITPCHAGQSWTVNIHSADHANWLSKCFNENKVILIGSKEFTQGVLDGYLINGGTVHEHTGTISLYFSNRAMMFGLAFLCSRLGIIGTCEHERHSYHISGSEALKWAKTINSCDQTITAQLAKLLLNNISTCPYQRIRDVILDPITSIILVPATEYVYDLTVPSTKNFSLWNGLGVADTFHTSGSSKSASFGIDAMRDIIFARKSPKNESCTIYFTNKRASYEEVLDSRRYIVGSVVTDFIKKSGAGIEYDIDNPEALSHYWWHDQTALLLDKKVPASTKVLRLFLDIAEMYKHHVTIKMLADVLERENPPTAVAIYGPIGDAIIDLYPNPMLVTEKLNALKQGAVPPELAELTYLETIVVPELDKIRVKGIAGIRQLYPIVSPVWRMVLLERKITEDDFATEQLRTFLTPYLGAGWLLFYNLNIIQMTGLIPENLAALCQLAGLQIIAGTDDRLIISMPDDRFRTSRNEIVVKVGAHKYRQLNLKDILRQNDIIYRVIDETLVKPIATGWIEEIDNKVFIDVPQEDIRQINDKFYRRIPTDLYLEQNGFGYERIVDARIKLRELKPSEYVTSRVSIDKSLRKSEIKRLTDEIIAAAKNLPEEERKAVIRRPVTIPRTQLMEAAEFVIAETEGSNLRELLATPGIDKNRTTCNNMYTLAETVGIEETRKFVIRALTNTIANTGSYVNPANIMFIAEFITSRGEPYGATYTGISRQPGGHLSLATLERAGKVFTQNALHGRREDIRNVSASIAVGARMAIGDGSFDIAQDIVENGIPKTIINDDLFTVLEKDDATKQLAAERELPAQPATIPAEDLAGGIDALKALTVGGTFDYTGAEDEANLITLFNPGEVIGDITAARPTQPGVPQKIIRRVQAQAIPPTVPHELVDVLAQIKIGIPLPQGNAGPEKVTITALETGITPVRPPPLTTTGLIPLAELVPAALNTGIPTGLENLLNQYLETQEREERVTLPEPLIVAQELPQVPIPELPDITGLNLGRNLIELRREQVANLEPINIAALQQALQ